MIKKLLVALGLLGVLTTGAYAQQTNTISVSRILFRTADGRVQIKRSGETVLVQGQDTDTGDYYTFLSFSTGSTPTLSLQGAALGTVFQTIAAGTVATLPTSTAILNFGTTDPEIDITSPGTYLIRATVQVEAAGATITTQTATFKLRRTNNTAADLTGGSFVLDIPVMTTLTHTIGTYEIEIYYTTTASDDNIELWGTLSGATGAGSITVSAAQVNAIRMK